MNTHPLTQIYTQRETVSTARLSNAVTTFSCPGLLWQMLADEEPKAAALMKQTGVVAGVPVRDRPANILLVGQCDKVRQALEARLTRPILLQFDAAGRSSLSLSQRSRDLMVDLVVFSSLRYLSDAVAVSLSNPSLRLVITDCANANAVGLEALKRAHPGIHFLSTENSGADYVAIFCRHRLGEIAETVEVTIPRGVDYALEKQAAALRKIQPPFHHAGEPIRATA